MDNIYTKFDWGEKLIKKYFLHNDYICIYNSPKSESHVLDFIFLHNKTLQLIYVEVKAKTHRKFYYDNGVDFRLFYVYRKLIEKNNLQNVFYILFVDPITKTCYGNTFEKLTEVKYACSKCNNPDRKIKYPLYDGDKYVYFPLAYMNTYFEFKDKKITKIKEII